MEKFGFFLFFLLLYRNTSRFQIWLITLPYVKRYRRNTPNEFGGSLHARVKKWNTFSQIPRHRGKKKLNPKCENTRKIHRLLTNQNPGFLYKVSLYKHTAFSWGCYGRLLHEGKNVTLWKKNITRDEDEVEGDILFPECGHLP